MDAGGSLTYMGRTMRLLLLLSAFLTALTGVVAGAATAAQPVQATASAVSTKQGVAAIVAAPLRARTQGFAASAAWHVAAPAALRPQYASFGERRRE
jgi:hypothetical protein